MRAEKNKRQKISGKARIKGKKRKDVCINGKRKTKRGRTKNRAGEDLFPDRFFQPDAIGAPCVLPFTRENQSLQQQLFFGVSHAESVPFLYRQ